MAEKKSDLSGLYAGIISAGIFLLSFFVLNLGIVSIGIAGGSFLAFALILRPAKSNKPMEIVSSGMSREMYDQIIIEASEKHKTMVDLVSKMKTGEIRDKAIKVCDVIYRIIEDLKQDPNDVKTARQFLSYYLDSILKIFQKYLDITSHRAKGQDVEAVIEKINDTLTSLYHALEKQLSKLLENDILDLDSELDLLKNTLKSQGLE
jgi:5-bromo-4-chloroindolyl phosphate hydrolysis protein